MPESRQTKSNTERTNRMINKLNPPTKLPRLTKTKFLSILAVAALLLTTQGLRAQAGGNQPEQNHLAGTWMVSGAPGVALGLESFLSDGRAIWTSPVTLGPEPGPGLALLRATGHGEWIRTGNHEFASTTYFLISDLTTEFLNLVKVTETITLNDTSDEFTQTGTVSVRDTEGKELFSFPNPVTNGKRIVAGE
jgi:hypothetical protein